MSSLLLLEVHKESVRIIHTLADWLTAQSNVAVRNIAEKLSDMGFSSWRLLVSKDFHLGWHEHLYTEIAPRIIRSDDFKPATARELLKGCQVILCTLSMLSNKRLRDCKYTQIVPFNILVVDEASQVEIGDYVPIITTFATSLSKICFIGDDKHSIYDHKLLSNPNHPIKSSVPSCFFIDVKSGKEQPSLKSTVNKQEQEAVCILAARFLEEDRSFKIITPYDAQRSALEELLKQKNLAWQDKCFNIDSFQGNEDDYIIISLVRTAALGFLDNPRRTNVMFTRCKRGMYICCNSNFVGGKAKDTLVGQMAEAFGEEAWIDWDDLVNGDF
ncbi:hypothetical protein PUNSTDRAFT_113158 [Punctularia strigosozonata HHB-11173 SS5]|uniref:uncharacterized protein n=1 Tax=Punctularia strigosozonata (strain HHB-11173) TaxID=741275 RepID=UPI00044172F2|nr:uncharacterized protein PUNSTDRAFT_113158 [Punctularia strigosozonata HHB-11173 SS5]EIN09803.1 hypothetical protein PUNSTDRAFT_113158 [Punctularia strigosozonata HHB-11173 SS5]